MSKADASEKMIAGTPDASSPRVGGGLAVGTSSTGEGLAMGAPNAAEDSTADTSGAGEKQVMGKSSVTKKPAMGKLGRFMRAIEPVSLVALPIVMALWAWLRLPNAALVTSACAIVALVPFFVSFEAERRRARDIMPIIVMTALAVAGRLIFAPVPAVKPVTALIIITGLCFGRDEGFITGALTMLVSNIFFGQGPWTVWQMFAWGIIGLIAGLIGRAKPLKKLYVLVPFAVLSAFAYSLIMDVWTVGTLMDGLFSGAAIAVFVNGLLFNIPHAIMNGVLCFLLFKPMNKRFERIKTKYDFKI